MSTSGITPNQSVGSAAGTTLGCIDAFSTRIRDRVRRDGVRATTALELRHLRNRLVLREEHVWFQLDLADRPASSPFPAGLDLVRAGEAQIDLLERLGQSPRRARAELAAGNDVWLVLEGEEPLYACHVIRRKLPMVAAPGGELELPEGVVAAENGVAAQSVRGRGVAPMGLALIADRLAGEGVRSIVLKVGTGNVAASRSSEKIGFRAIAVMEHERVGSRRRTAVHPLGDGLGDELAERLTYPPRAG
jgi:hypothetical protein